MQNNIQIYNNPLYQPYPEAEFTFNVGEYVFAIQSGNTYYTRAIILNKINNLTYIIQFDNGVMEIQNINSLLIYYPCNCNGQINSQIYPSGFLVTNCSPGDFTQTCLYPTYIPGQPVL